MGTVGALRKLTHLSAWKPRAREWALLAATVSGPVALLVSLLTAALLVAAVAADPKPVNTYDAISSAQRAQNYARNALLLWLGGTRAVEKPLLSRNRSERSVALSDTGFEVFAIDPVDLARYPGADAVEWVVTLSATLVPPGQSAPQASLFRVFELEHGAGYQLLTWPVIVNPGDRAFTVAGKYTVPVERNGSLGQSAQRFVTAYLTSTGPAASLGQYVSARFSGGAVAGSPYSSAEVESIKALAGSPQPATAKPGTQISVLVRVKASASVGTWSVMDLPLRMSLGANNIWLVDGFDVPLRWGRITSG